MFYFCSLAGQSPMIGWSSSQPLSLTLSLSFFRPRSFFLSVCTMSAPPYSLGPNAQRRYYPTNSNATSTASLLPPSSQQDMPRRQFPPSNQFLQTTGFQPSSVSPKSATPTLRSTASNNSLVSTPGRPPRCQALGHNVRPYLMF